MAKKNLPLILQEHQVAKRALWLNYLKKYLHVLGREAQTPCVHVYDLFCGSTFPAATLDAVSQTFHFDAKCLVSIPLHT
ncbi:MAG: hypothetical protein RIS64_602 [Bacteroidota bacterium]|jgi:hypothetical protein